MRAETGQLAGRVAVVTGGADGIGAGIVRRFHAEGAQVVVADFNEDRGRATAAEVDGLFVKCDVAQRADVVGVVEAAVSTYGAVDIVVNNAWGGGSLSRAETKTDEALQHGMDVGFFGPYWAMQAALPHMKKRGWGRVVNMVSLNGINAHMGTLEYNAAKEACRALTRTAAREWAPTGVTVNALAPAARSAAFLRSLEGNPELAAAADQANPMGRMGDPYDDIAPVAVFLASDASRYVTGNTLFVDGGSHINGAPWIPDLGPDT